MKKSDLVAGKHVVKYRDGRFRFVGEINGLLDSSGEYVHKLCFYDERLNDFGGNKEMDIVAVYELNEVWKREEPTITEDEKVILRNLPEKYRFITRDKSGELYIYQNKPGKGEEAWQNGVGNVVIYLMVFNHLFQMVKWEDNEPWKIEDLLKLDVKKDG